MQYDKRRCPGTPNESDGTMNRSYSIACSQNSIASGMGDCGKM